ncbi:hypothetical protein DY000_02020499 [Brassica cretica]|uniref:Ubiquitin-like protease family profile domain-containing protein n=1 Tax=Brassica cretica TaxID=69181 RepID=A0ABQ7EGN1_BRACR|nr:hypothetical protein DY000_02020499 [Brassica cretica]
MDLPALPQRMYTLGEESPALKSISYHTDDSKLFTALRRALNADEYEELKESKLGVFIKFKELNFGWASRLVHYMLSFQLNIKKKFELWSLVGPQPVRFSLLEFEHLTGLNCDYIEDLENPRVEVTKEMAAFWEMMGVDVDAGPTTEHIKAAFGRCEECVINFVHKDYAEMFPRWYFDVEDPAAENIIKVMLNAKANWKWTMDCWEVTDTNPRVKKEVSVAETESGVKEESARPRKKARKEASVEASKVPSAGFSKSDASTSVGGLTKEQIEKSFKDIADVMMDGFGMFLKEIKLLGDRMEAVEKKVGITKKRTASNELQITTSNSEKRGQEPGSESVNEAKAGHNDPQEPSSLKDLSLVIANEPEEKPPEQSGEPSLLVLDKEVPTDSDLQKGETRRQIKRNAAMVHVRGKSERARKLADSQTPFKANSIAKVIIPNKRVGQGYDLFAPFEKKMPKVLTDWVKLDPYFKTPMAKKPRRCPSRFYLTLRTPLEWLNDGSSVKSSREDLSDDLRLSRLHIDAFINVLKQRYQDNPHHFRSERLCFLDHVFSRQWSHHYLEFKSDEGDINGLGRRLPGGAWNYPAGIVPSFCQSKKVWGLDVDDIYAPVNFRNEHWIAIWISIRKRHIVVWDRILTHIGAADLDVLMEPFVNMCRAGDCGAFALKYIECHPLRMSFPPALCNKNSKAIREKMALDIFKETPEGHAKGNEDNDENSATYDQQGSG